MNTGRENMIEHNFEVTGQNTRSVEDNHTPRLMDDAYGSINQGNRLDAFHQGDTKARDGLILPDALVDWIKQGQEIGENMKTLQNVTGLFPIGSVAENCATEELKNMTPEQREKLSKATSQYAKDWQAHLVAEEELRKNPKAPRIPELQQPRPPELPETLENYLKVVGKRIDGAQDAILGKLPPGRIRQCSV
jgi:hypothetical protein